MNYFDLDRNKKYCSDRVWFEKHDKKDILVIDYKGLKYDKLVEFYQELSQFLNSLKNYPPNVLLLVIYENARFNKETIDFFKKEFIKYLNTAISKCALIGFNSIQLIMIKSVNRLTNTPTKQFKTKEEAIEYLISD